MSVVWDTSSKPGAAATSGTSTDEATPDALVPSPW